MEDTNLDELMGALNTIKNHCKKYNSCTTCCLADEYDECKVTKPDTPDDWVIGKRITIL